MKKFIEQGAKAGIGIALRRGDLDLLKTCFDLLWGTDPISLTRSWLRWRLPVFVAHDFVYLMGEFVEFSKRMIDQQVVVNSKEEERGYRAFLYKLALAKKVRDAPALVGLSVLQGRTVPAEESIIDLEFVSTYSWLHMAQFYEMTGLDEAAHDLYAHLMHEKKPPGFFDAGRDPYTKDTVDFLHNMASSAGTHFDRCVALAAMVLWGRRPFPKEKIKAEWKEQVRRLLAEKPAKPQTVDLPWYVHDPTTEIGQRVLKKMKDKGVVSALWLHAETFKIKKDDMQIKPLHHSVRPDVCDSVWWVPYLQKMLAFEGMTAREAMNLWKTVWRDQVEHSVSMELVKK